MKDWLELGRRLPEQGWILELFLIVAGMLVANLLLRRLMARLQRRAARTETLLDDALLASVRAPTRALVWVVGLSLVAQVLIDRPRYEPYLHEILKLAVLWALGWFLVLLARNYGQVFCRRGHRRGEPIDDDLYMALAKVVQAAVVVTVGLVTLQTFGVGITGLLTFGGVGGLVAGFAAKDLLGNFFGGLMLHLDRPFRSGDWVRVRDQGIEGTVERIGWRQTRIRTHSRNMLFVPNGLFLTAVIENPGQMSHRMIREVIGLRYDDLERMAAIVADVERMLRESPYLDQELPLLVRFDAFNASSVDFFLQCYTRTVERAKFTEIKQELLYAVADIVARHGAEIAFPTRTLHVQRAAGAPDS